MNILFTSAGRRGYLIKYFKEALGNLGEIHVANSTSHSTAMKHGDQSVVTPLIYSKEYIPFLKRYCEENRIGALISLFDIDLPILSDHLDEFEKIGVKVIISNKEVISICNDKWLTFNYLMENGFNTPMTFLSVSETLEGVEKGLVGFPFIIKPRWGMGSIAVFEADNIEELNVFVRRTRNIIKSTYLSYEAKQNIENCVVIQEKIAGQEFGLDIINDLEGDYKVTVIKKKLVMRSGETDSAETIQSDVLEKTGARLGRMLGHIGNLDTDAFILNGVPYILEMNARFGGGYPFSHLAGVNLPKAIINWLRGVKVEKSLLEAKSGVIGYKDLTIIENQVEATPLVHS